MNRIILIGNGFDKAHNLPTSYAEFFEYYWQQRIDELRENRSTDDVLCSFRKPIIKDWSPIVDAYDNANSLNDFFKSLAQYTSYTISLSPFFKTLKIGLERKGWVDIENDYYRTLKDIIKKYSDIPNESPRELEKLHNELDFIKNKLTEYLNKIQKDSINSSIVNNRIKRIIYEPFRAKDVSRKGYEAFRNFIAERWNSVKPFRECYIEKYGIKYSASDIDFYKKSVSDRANNPIAKLKNLSQFDIHIKNILTRKDDDYPQDGQTEGTALDYYLLPKRIMLLTFNYTNSANLYRFDDPNVVVNHIHGALNAPQSIVFGYGDDTNEEYSFIENLNNDKYLDNIKVFKYLENDNYRGLLDFLDSAPYQICLMGHSCGTSDRTLLNTLFEHKNCISIKPYFYQKSEDEDDYIKLAQHISRNFKDKKTMRDIVVNKTYCEPLPQSDLKIGK